VPYKSRLPACLSFSPWFERILLHPRKVISGIFVITLFFAWHISHLSFDTSVYDLAIENIPETLEYDAFKKLFGSDEMIRIVVKGKYVFDPDTFQIIRRISEETSRIAGVRRIISLPEIKKGIDISGKLSPDEFADRIRPVELFRKNLISDDFKSTSLTLILSDHADRDAVIQQVNRIIETEAHGLTAYQIGIPVVSEALSELTRKDLLLLMPFSILMFVIILSLLYRNINCVLLPLTCVLIALVWTFGLMALCGIAMSMLTVMVPIFLLAIGVTYYLHICSEYLSFSETCRDPVQVARLTFSSIAFPTFLAALTTIIGFGSLWINQIPAIREFSFFSCFGILSILVVLFTLYPAALVVLPLPQKKAPGFVDHFFDGLVKKIITLNLNRQHVTLPLIIGLSVFCLAGIFRIQVETNPMSYMKADMPVSRHFHDIYKDLSGSFPLNVIMEGNGSDHFETPAHVNALLQAKRILEKLPGVDKAVSYADYLMLVNYAMNRFDPKFYAVPEEAFEVRMLVNNYKMLLGQDLLTSFMNPEFSKANILLFTHFASSNEFLDARKKILSSMQEQFPSAKWQVTGLGMAIASSSRLLTQGQIQSLTLTLAVIFCIMLALFMSFKVAGISILPNMIPIVINFGVMGWIGIELSMVTSLIASIAIGMAVDDIIHYLVRYNQKFKTLMDKKRALENTLKHIGNQMIFSSVAVCAGFFILAFSSFRATAIFGIMMVIIMFSGLFADIVLLPSLMLHVELVTLWDLIRIKMGKGPDKGIPLFSGLRKTQIQALMMASVLRKIDAGQVLFRKGEVSDFMYAIVAGSFDVLDPDIAAGNCGNPGLWKRIARLGQGDVVGEMGFLRSAPRSATVIAAEEGELLLISWKIIQRLQWLYPPIAHKFFHNMMTIICDRLERSTRCLTELKCADDLTGLCNRNEFERIVDIEISRSRRYESKLVVCMVRLFFPAPEDREQENCSLKRIEAAARQLSRQLRKCDTICRYDVHTFSILMPETDLDSAYGVCTRLREMIRAQACDEMPFSTAHGIATLSGHSDGPSSLLSRAEALLSLT